MTGPRMPELANAACRDPQVSGHFNTRRGGRLAASIAVQTCNTCWDRPECLAWGLQHERGGIWGGNGNKGLADLRKEFDIPLNEIFASNYAPRSGTS